MASYGTIPTTSGQAGTSSSPFDFISRGQSRAVSALATSRPWHEFGAETKHFGIPPSLGEAYLRIRSNAVYFAMNYCVVVLVVVFLSLLWHPVSLIVFAVAFAAWLFFYFLRDESDGLLVIFGYQVGDGLLVPGLAILTLVLLLLTNATTNILVSLLIGLVAVLVHASLRKTDDLNNDEESAGPARWYAAVAEAVPAVKTSAKSPAPSRPPTTFRA